MIGSERCPSVQGWRRGPPENYLKKCDQYHLVPEPKMMQLIQSLHKAKRPELDLKDQRIGDDHALAVMDSMACSDPIHVVVKNCRLKAKGVKAVCDALVAHCTRLEELDMSDNQCRRPKAAKAVAALLDCKGCDSLEKLRGSFDALRGKLRDDAQFRDFYTFCFAFAKEPGFGVRTLPLEVALQMWQLTLTGKFAALGEWSEFLQETGVKAITSDVWNMLLTFANDVSDDMSSYDEDGAWPVVFDDFVHQSQPRAFLARNLFRLQHHLQRLFQTN